MALTKVSSSLVSDNAITTGKLVDGGVHSADIATNAITSTKIAQNSILTKHIDDGQVTTAQLGADAVTAAKIADDAISEEHLDVTVITGLTEVTAATGDLLMVADISDSNNLKKIPVSSILAGTHTGAVNTSGTINSGALGVTGNIAVSGTVDGIDIAARDAVLTSTTTTAGAALPKAGGTLTGNLVITSEGDGLKLIRSGYDSYSLQQSAGNGLAIYNVTDSRTELFFTGDGKVGIGSSGMLGVGTTAPGVELDILRHTNAYPLRIGSSQGQGRAIVFADMHASPSKYNWVAGAQFGTDNAFEITPSTGVGGYTFTAGTGTTFLQDGKVGIGTNAPGGAAGSLSVWGRGTSSPSATNAATSYSNAMFRINHFANSSVGLSIGSAGGNVTYIQSSYNEGTTSPLLINPYSNNAATSFIGMGNVTSPAATVHIRPTGNDWEHALLLQHNDTNTGWNIHPESQDDSLWFGYNANTAAGITDQTASEYVVFDSSGGVGIGNSRPTINAHAAANNLVIGNTSTTDNGMTILGSVNNTGRIFFGDPDLNRSGQIEYVHNGDILQFYTGNALSTRMTEGRLGINVTPSEAFHTYVASGSNEYRNQLGSNSMYMRHGVTRNTPQAANVFDILGLNNQDIVVGTSNMFLVGDGGMHNSEGTNRLRVDANGVTIGEVLPTLTTTNESLQRRLWVRGQGVFHSQDQGTLLPRAGTSALNIGPSSTRGNTGNPGTAAYNATTPTGHVHGGIAWDHLMNYSTYGNMGYNSRPHGWLGMELHSTPGYELSNMIMCTREGTASTSEPLIAQRWYATGEITTPRNPAFAAYGSGLANQTTEGNHGTWNETLDRGGNFTAGTNAYFTAPVDGLYAFWAHCNFNTASSTPYYWRAFKNTGGVGIFYGAGPNQSWDHIMAYIMIAMDKNDTFEWRYKGDPDEGAEWAQCGGYLVG